MRACGRFWRSHACQHKFDGLVFIRHRDLTTKGQRAGAHLLPALAPEPPRRNKRQINSVGLVYNSGPEQLESA